MKRRILKSFVLTSILSIVVVLVSFTKSYSADFKPINSQEAVKNISPGWTLGNTLDAIPTEGSWNYPPAEEYIFDDIKKAGFKSVRIPVTWAYHMGPAPDYKVDSKWMDRVEQVVDWALKRDFYVILTVHHDSWLWVSIMAIDPETGKYVNDYENNIIKFEKLWEQIAEKFKGKSEKLILEILNEPDAGQWVGQLEKPTDPNNPERMNNLTPRQMNDLTNRILKIIRSSGGYNDKRLVILGHLGNLHETTLKFFRAPDDEYIILTVHYYDEWNFLQNWGVTTWGTEEEKKHVDEVFKQLYSRFIQNGLPVVIGEWGTLARDYQLSRWYYYDYIPKTAYKYGIPCMLWDNGYDRKNRIWRDEIAKDIVINAGKGISNSFIFPVDNYFKPNTNPEDLTVKLELNGNQLLDIYNGENKLVKDVNYILDIPNSSVTIKKEYLAKLLESPGLGTIASFKFDFSKGVDMPMYIIRYDLPKFPESTIIIDKSKTKGKIESDITIPVSFNGTKLDKISLIDKANKKPVIDTSTPYLRMYRQFDCSDNGITLKEKTLNSINTDSLITFEFLPGDIKVEMEILILNPNLMAISKSYGNEKKVKD